MSISRLLVSIFDVHLWTRPIDGASLHPNVAFFADPTAYRAMRGVGAQKPLGRLFAFPLDGETKRNHFWPRYFDAALLDPVTAGSRDFLIPLRCRPQKLSLEFKAPMLKQPAKAHATVWLWQFGWSSVIDFEIKGSFDFESIRDLHQALLAQAPEPFVLNAKPAHLSAVFMALADMVRQDVALPGKAPSDVAVVKRQIVLSAWLEKGAEARRYESDGTSAPTWSNGDQVEMHGALLGKKIGFPELKEFDRKPRKYLLTQMGAADFAITHYDKGTLILLRHWSDARRRRDSNRCLTSNIRNFSVVAQMLIQLIQNSKANGAKPPKTGTAADARGLLGELAKFYRNPICGSYLASHGALK